MRKNCCSLDIVQITTPPAPPPSWTTCTAFFRRQNSRFSLELNIAKGTTDPRIEFCLPKLLILVISQGQTQSLIKFHLQNIDQAPTSKSRHQQTSVSRLNLKFKILTKPGFRISTKIQLHYHFKTSAAKY